MCSHVVVQLSTCDTRQEVQIPEWRVKVAQFVVTLESLPLMRGMTCTGITSPLGTLLSANDFVLGVQVSVGVYNVSVAPAAPAPSKVQDLLSDPLGLGSPGTLTPWLLKTGGKTLALPTPLEPSMVNAEEWLAWQWHG